MQFQSGVEKSIRCKGFTLVELLVATFILAVVISTVYGAYRTTFHVINGAEQRLEMVHNARNILDRFVDDLRSIVVSENGMILGDTESFSGSRGDRLSFISTKHLMLSKKDTAQGHAVITYHAEFDDESQTLKFFRSDTLLRPGVNPLENEAPSYVIGSELQEIRITYFGEGGEETDTWESGSLDFTDLEKGEKKDPVELPLRVEIAIIYGVKDDEESRFSFTTSIALPQLPEEEQ